MRGFVPIVFTITGIALCATQGLTAVAEPPSEPNPEPGAQPKLITPVTTKLDDPAFSHQGKIGISPRFGAGLRAIATYDEKIYCGSSDRSVTSGNAPVCLGRAPFAVGLELSYGLTRRVDLLAEVSISLEQDFASTPSTHDGPHPGWVAPGARFWFSEAASSSLFATAQLVIDYSGYKDTAGAARGADLGVRSLQGYWWDLTRSFGLYVYASETAQFARWIDLELDVGIGLQARYP